MRITYFANACVLVEEKGTKILCDPWLIDGVYYGSWFHYPPLKVAPEDFFDCNFIYISHIHPDHLDAASLALFPKTITILIHDFADKYVRGLIQKLGFQTIIEVAHKEEFRASDDLTLKILAADNCDPYLCGRYLHCTVPSPYEKTKQIDTLAVFKGEKHIAINTNDCPYALAKTVCDDLVLDYPKIDFLLVGYRGAGPYPQCFENLNSRQKMEAALSHSEQMMQQGMNYIKHLRPVYFLPFAGQYTLGGKFADYNDYLMPQAEQLPQLFSEWMEREQIGSHLILLNSEESFDLDKQKASAEFVAPDPLERKKYIDDVLRKKRFVYEDDVIPKDLNLIEKLNYALQRMNAHRKFYHYEPTFWNIYLDIGENHYYKIPFDGSEHIKVVSALEVQIPYLKIGVDLKLLLRILDRKAHWNNAEVGSHLRFYREPNEFQRSIHFLMSFFHC